MRSAMKPLVLAATLALAAIAPGALAAGSHTVTVGAVVLSSHNCRFLTGNSTLDFGSIDPSGSTNRTATVNVGYRCTGGGAIAFWAVTSDDGLHESGPGAPRMRHTVNAAEYLAYSLNVPANGSAPRNTNQTLTITGTITPAQYAAAAAGSYADTVVLTIAP